MGKRILQLYADDDDIALAKSRGMNLSSWFREVLEVELRLKDKLKGTNDKDTIIKLKSKISLLLGELKEKDKRIAHLKKVMEFNKPKRVQFGKVMEL